ncbi:MAG: radical SAM protein [Sulfolobales archaeon]
MNSGALALDRGKLRVCRLLKRIPILEFYRVVDPRAHLDLVKNTIGKTIGIYVHVPFCRSTCMFCPYNRYVLRSRDEVEKYFRALTREVGIYGKLMEGAGLRVVEMHVGGGTPSLVSPKLYAELLRHLSQFFEVRCGLGIEVNPEDFRRYEDVEEFYSAGVDEVSIGVQSFDKRVLKSLGRKHLPEDSVNAIRNSLEAGFKWVSVDLMFLAPSINGYVELTLGEKIEAFRRDLEKSYELGVHQITFYPTVIPWYSPGYRLVELGRVRQEVDSIDRFVDEAMDFAEDRGLHIARVYSISSKPYEYATVNLEMVGPLLGFGAGAWSNTGLYQYVNLHSVSHYISAIERDALPAMYSRNMSASSRAWRLFFDQLTTARVDEEAFRSIGLKGMPLKMKLLLKVMELNSLVRRDGSTHRLTRRGIKEVYKFVTNYIIEVPIKATGLFIQVSRSEDYPEVVKLS